MKFKIKTKKTVKPTDTVLEFCINNIKTMEVKDKEKYELYNRTTNYLMKEKIFKLTEEESKYLICFFGQRDVVYVHSV